MGGRVLEDTGRSPKRLQRILVLLRGSHVSELDTTERQHRQNHRQGHLSRLARADEDQQRSPVGALKNEVAANVVERIILSFGVIRRNAGPVVHHALLAKLRRGVLDLGSCNSGCDVRGLDDVDRRELGCCLGQGRLGQKDSSIQLERAVRQLRHLDVGSRRVRQHRLGQREEHRLRVCIGLVGRIGEDA